ncbi:hypothetical protein LWC34_12540 [Kibdelosporangium philippinense]|uniref:Uncharacterized protein n=1 Tax=Kibdelosporangium philippinense TaxID=211113 RepID=A0ABS8Z821_9PSEU|nr:hypothetical protein [Kibdelosporangium philippinense]MCE7003647.1 hypothetical protein [Kibdelosporangium philippinense]
MKPAGVTPEQLREFNSYMWAPDAEKRRQNRFTELKATATGRDSERDSMRIWMSVPNDSLYNSRAIDLSQYVGNNPEMPRDARFEACKAANLEKISPTYLRYIPVGPLQFPRGR